MRGQRRARSGGARALLHELVEHRILELRGEGGNRVIGLRGVEQRGQARQPAPLESAAVALGQVLGHLLHLGRLQRTEDVGADEVAVVAAAGHGSTSISSRIRRRLRSA